MKKGVHPDNYRPVVFQDLNDNTTFLTRSTVATDETVTLDGVEYPLVKVHISSSSHPFYTGQEKLVDIEGRVDKFKARQRAGQSALEAKKARAAKIAKKPAKVPANEEPKAEPVQKTPAETPDVITQVQAPETEAKTEQ